MKILVPVDGSPASANAVKLAIDQVKAAAGASLVLVNVQNRATAGVAEATGLMPSGWIEQEEEQSAADALQNAVTACREAGVTYVIVHTEDYGDRWRAVEEQMVKTGAFKLEHVEGSGRVYSLLPPEAPRTLRP